MPVMCVMMKHEEPAGYHGVAAVMAMMRARSPSLTPGNEIRSPHPAQHEVESSYTDGDGPCGE